MERGLAPDLTNVIVPLEYVAAAVVALAEHPRGAGETVHLVVDHPPTHAEMLEMITERLGLRGLSLVDRRGGPLADPSPLEEMVGRMLAGYREYLEQHVRFDDTTARRLLDGSGVSPATLSPEAVHHLIDQALVERRAAISPRFDIPVMPRPSSPR